MRVGENARAVALSTEHLAGNVVRVVASRCSTAAPLPTRKYVLDTSV